MRLFRPRHRLPVPLGAEQWVQRALAQVAPQVTALTTQLPQALVITVVQPLLTRLTALCWDLPASETHHHRRAYGLLTHSLEVATHALETFSQSSLWWAKVPDPAQRHGQQAQWRLGTALAGLLHDLGKVFDVTVTLTTAAGDSATWDPLRTPLLVWLLSQTLDSTLPTPTCHWQPGRGMRHETVGALAATLLLTRADLVTLTLPVARELWTFLGGGPDPANLFRQLLVRPAGALGGVAADGQSVRADLALLPPVQPTLAAQVLDTLAQSCRDGSLRVNQYPGQVFVRDAETLVVVPAALRVVRERLSQAGVTLPGNTLVYNDLATACAVLGTAGQNVARAALARPGKAPVTFAVLRIPNALLWGAQAPAPYPGTVALEERTPAEMPPEVAIAPLAEAADCSTLGQASARPSLAVEKEHPDA